MKSLDEVITIMDGIDQTCTCCAYQHDCDETECIEKTALHYLKEYRVVTDICHRHGIASIWGQVLPDPEKNDWYKRLNFDGAYDNDPLTWDELRQMEGKPVWVEVEGYYGFWTIVHWNSNIVFKEYYDWNASPEDPMKAPLVSLDDTNFGKTWQAYRNERE